MPKSLKVHANERVDIPDFERAANDYTNERAAFEEERLVLDRRSRVLEGFRVKIEDQTATPGAITVFNGTALDRDGYSLHDEEQADASVTLTLSGAATTFYLEVELATADTDTDAREFWDPTFDNGAPPAVDGAEFAIPVATRVTPTWRIVQPVSTTAFASTADPGSTKIPLAILTTDGSNVINGTSTVGLVQVDAASVTESSITAGGTLLRVFDSRLLGNVGDDVILGFGLGTSETATLTANDKDNGIIQFAASTNAHGVGEIVQAAGTGRLMQEKQDPNNSSAHPDNTRRLWQGDEVRGGALTQSKDAVADRDDLNVRTLKDKLDMYDGLIRELKWGAFDPATTSVTPPTVFASRPRYFHNAGSVAGSRAVTLTIGNGTSTFGDYNGTDENVFLNALNALPNTGGAIHVKAGTYQIGNQVGFATAGKDVVFTAEYGTVVVEQRNSGGAAFLINQSGDLIGFHGFIFNVAGTGTQDIFEASAGRWEMRNCDINGSVLASGASTSLVLDWHGVNIVSATGNEAFYTTKTGTGVSGLVTKCEFRTTTDTSVDDVSLRGLFTSCRFNACRFQGATTYAYRCVELAAGLDVQFTNCFFQGRRAVEVDTTVNATFTGCFFLTQANTLDAGILLTATDSALFNGCHIHHQESSAPDTSSTPMIAMFLDGASEGTTISGCTFEGESGATIYTVGIACGATTTRAAQVRITGCDFKWMYVGVYLDTTTAGVAPPGSTFNVSNCTVDFDALAYSEVYGIVAAGGPEVELNVSNCTVSNGHNADSCIGIGFVDMETDSRLIVDGCTVEGLGTVSGSGSVFGILCTGTAAVDEGSAIISNNHVRTLATSSTQCAGIFVNGIERAVITGNVVEGLTTVTGTISAVGTGPGLGAGHEALVISDNIIQNMTAATSGTIKAVEVLSFPQTVVKGNIIHGIATATTTGSRAIEITAATQSVIVGSNNIFMEAGASPAGDDVQYCVYVDVPSLGMAIIENNAIKMGDVASRGIKVDPNSPGVAYGGVSIAGNTISDMTAAGAKGIEVTGPSNFDTSGPVSVTGNTIQVSAYNATHGGIIIVGNSGFELEGVAITGNNIWATNTTNTRTAGYANAGIGLTYCDYVSVSGNTVRWNQAGTSSGEGIVADNCQQGAIAGNIVTPASTGGNEISHTGGDFAIVGNCVGGGGQAGTVGGVGSTYTVDPTAGTPEPLNHLGP